MLKYVLKLLLLSLVSFSIKAQQQPFDGGISGGITGAQIDGDTYFGFRHFGFNAGAFTRVKFYEDLQLMLEIRYCGRGATYTGTEESPALYRRSLHYIDFPISAMGIFNKYSLNLGLSPGLLLSSSLYDNAGLSPAGEIPFKSMDLGVFIGGGYTIRKDMWVSLRYTYSAVPIRERTTANNSFNNYSTLGRILKLRDGDFNNYLNITLYYILDKND